MFDKPWKDSNLLREFSMPRAVALNKHYSDAEELILHLFKIYFCSTDATFNHWTNEVAARSNYTYRLKTKNKYLSQNEIASCWLGPIETDEEFDVFYRIKLPKIADDYRDIKDITKEDLSLNKENAKKFIHDYLEWASAELSERGSIETEEIKGKLETLLKEGSNCV